MIARVIDRPNVQAMLSALRAAKLTVTGSARKGYEAYARDELVFSALPGRRGYLCRIKEDLFI